MESTRVLGGPRSTRRPLPSQSCTLGSVPDVPGARSSEGTVGDPLAYDQGC